MATGQISRTASANQRWTSESLSASAIGICAIMLVYTTEVNDFVLEPILGDDFWRDSPAGLYFHMAFLANLSFKYSLVWKIPVPRNQWLRSAQRQRYGSQCGKTMVQGTAAAAAAAAKMTATNGVTVLRAVEPAPDPAVAV
ncbi:MAG: hypothetical protein ACRD7E_01285 [Bryobacteraceae bacterium]